MNQRWTVAEAVSWIGFGDAQPLANWGKFTPSINKWQLQPPDGLLEPLNAIAKGLSTERLDASTTKLAVDLIQRSGRTAAALKRQLQRDLKEKQRFDDIINDAFTGLQKAVFAGQVGIFAVPEDRPFEARGRVDPDLFGRFPLAIHLLGSIGPADVRLRGPMPKYTEAALEPATIRKAWPPPPAVKPAMWMLKEARKYLKERKAKAKRDDLLQRCMAATKSTHAEALAAYRALPPDVRRSQGRHDR